MTFSGYWVLVGILAVFNYAFAFILSIEISAFDLMTTRKKLLWNLLAWGVPVIGPIFTHRYLEIGWAKGDSAGGNNTMLPPGDGF
ncbi:hypothetical protein [Zooshikella ganghwensis]|uniref:hypothetical protein n=1 Tax=Zooshikella ganghwensis TaxID=202772 RepID=UPI00042A8FE2|nr:hypothetical protein [Zooshikella ganghwensis]